MAFPLPTDILTFKGRIMADETSENDQATNREKYALLKEFHRTLRQALTGAEYKVFCALEDWSESKGECWHSQSTIADACDISLRSVNASIKELETMNLIETKERTGQSSLYVPAKPTYAKIAYLRDDLRKNCTGRYANSAHPPTQKLRINVSNLNGSNINELIPTPNGVGAAPPASKTIDFPDYKPTEPEPPEQLPEALPRQEASQPGPATDKDRAVPGDSSLHIPAPHQPDLTQEVKGFEAGDRGRDMAHGKKARDKPKVKGKEPDSRRNHPNVEFYKLHMHYSAKEDQLELLTSEEFDFTRLLDAFKFWKDSGYYRGNIRGVIDVYHDKGKLYGYRSQRRQNLAGNGITTPRAFNPIPKPIKPRGSRPDGGFTTAEFAEDY